MKSYERTCCAVSKVARKNDGGVAIWVLSARNTIITIVAYNCYVSFILSYSETISLCVNSCLHKRYVKFRHFSLPVKHAKRKNFSVSITCTLEYPTKLFCIWREPISHAQYTMKINKNTSDTVQREFILVLVSFLLSEPLLIYCKIYRTR